MMVEKTWETERGLGSGNSKLEEGSGVSCSAISGLEGQLLQGGRHGSLQNTHTELQIK